MESQPVQTATVNSTVESLQVASVVAPSIATVEVDEPSAASVSSETAPEAAPLSSVRVSPEAVPASVEPEIEIAGEAAASVDEVASAASENVALGLALPPSADKLSVIAALEEKEKAVSEARDYEVAMIDESASPEDPALPSESRWQEIRPDGYVVPEGSAITKSGTVGGPVAGAARSVSGALDGIIVYTTPGHGFLAYSTSPYWRTQRGVTNDMIEDFGNVHQFNQFVHYLFNAGATVVPIRPIGYQPNEVVLDNDDSGVTWSGTWTNSTSTIFYGSSGDVPYRWADVSSFESAVARYTPSISEAGEYPVYCWTRYGTDRIRQLYRIVHSGGTSELRVDHQKVGCGWVYLGTYYFESGTNGYVEISNYSPDQTGVVIADTIRFGNGPGDVNIGYGTSGYERELEGAKYWVKMAQGQGTPDLYTTYSDVSIRPRYAAYMNNSAYGSFYDRIYMSFHSNASGGTARGAMGLGALNDYPANQYNFAITWNNEIESDMEALDQGVAFGQDWVDNSGDYYNGVTYGEISNTGLQGEMTGTIIEVAFHDNADDANLMKDPVVRNVMGRSSYQALVKFLNTYGGNGVPLNLLPDPPTHARVTNNGNGTVNVAWSAPATDSAGGDAATGFVVYRSSNGFGFGNPVTVSGGSTTNVNISGLTAGNTYYFRVAATNAGGESMPTETVGVRVTSSGSAPILVVNGYDRLDKFIMPRRYIGQNINNYSTFVRPDQANDFTYIVTHGKAIVNDGKYFESCSNEAVEGGQIDLTDYDAVVWIGGQQSSVSPETFPSFSSTLVTKVESYLNAGGNLFVSGAEIAWDMDRDTNQADANSVFIQDYLKADYVDDNVYTNDSLANTANGVSGSIFDGLSGIAFDNGDDGVYKVGYPDVINSTGGSSVALVYTGSTESNVNAAIQYDGSTFNVVYMAFPFETIYTESTRNTVMSRVLDFLIGSTPTPTPTPSQTPTPSPTPSPTPLPNWDASYVSDTFPSQMVTGEVVSVTITYKNEGSQTWDSMTRFATSNPRGRSSDFYYSTWVNNDRPGDLDQASVGTGSNGSFTFDIQAPGTAGSYTEAFELVEDGVSWFEGTGDDFTWNVTVVTPTPTPSPTPSPSPTPTPTLTPSPSPSPTPTGQDYIKVEVEDYDTGGEGVAYHDTDSGNTGGQYRSDDVDIETCTAGGYNVGWIYTGEWLKFSDLPGNGGTYNVKAQVASYSAGGSFHLEVNGTNVTGTVSFSATSGWQTWTIIDVGQVSLNNGDDLKLVVESDSWNIDWIEFSIPDEVIVDNDDGSPVYTETGTWSTSGTSGYNGGTYRWANMGASSTATWDLDIPATGSWTISVIYRSGTNRCTSTKYVVSTASGDQTVYVDQTANNLTWVTLGTFNFNSGDGSVTVDALGSTGGSVVISDAVKAAR